MSVLINILIFFFIGLISFHFVLANNVVVEGNKANDKAKKEAKKAEKAEKEAKKEATKEAAPESAEASVIALKEEPSSEEEEVSTEEEPSSVSSYMPSVTAAKTAASVSPDSNTLALSILNDRVKSIESSLLATQSAPQITGTE